MRGVFLNMSKMNITHRLYTNKSIFSSWNYCIFIFMIRLFVDNLIEYDKTKNNFSDKIICFLLILILYESRYNYFFNLFFYKLTTKCLCCQSVNISKYFASKIDHMNFFQRLGILYYRNISKSYAEAIENRGPINTQPCNQPLFLNQFFCLARMSCMAAF